MPSKKIVWAAELIEKWILPFAYLYFAWWALQDLDPFNFGGFWSQPLSKRDLITVADDVFLFVTQFSIGVFLLINRRVSAEPQNLREVFVPLLASFFFVTYNFVPRLPTVFQASLLPLSQQALFAKVGLVVGAIGPVISAWGVLSLGRSFGILVSVRKVVLRGPYRYVRHPIYLGYFFLFGGWVLAEFCPAFLILFPIHFAIMAWRAKLEEARLSSFSPEYKANMARTGFFFPKLWPARKIAPKP